MNKNVNLVLTQIVNEKAREFSLKKESREHSDSVVSIFREDWHLYTWLNHPLVPPLEIQCSISVEGDYVRAVWFPHPVLITLETKTNFILLANEANLELHSGGRFWCNEDMDFAYEIVLPKVVIESCRKDVAKLLFDIPYSHFTDLLIPLTMLSNRTWQSHTAIKYIKELRTNGFVDNSDYELW